MVVSAAETGAKEFIDAVWKNGELYVDEREAFKYALGTSEVRSWWVLKPSVLRHVLSYSASYGTANTDIKDPKTRLLGGTFVVRNGEVVHVHRETASFDNGDASEVLAAVLGQKPLADKSAHHSETLSTPSQSEACDAEACKR